MNSMIIKFHGYTIYYRMGCKNHSNREGRAIGGRADVARQVYVSLKEGRGGLYHFDGGKESCPRGEYTRDTR